MRHSENSRHWKIRGVTPNGDTIGIRTRERSSGIGLESRDKPVILTWCVLAYWRLEPWTASWSRGARRRSAPRWLTSWLRRRPAAALLTAVHEVPEPVTSSP